MNLLVSFVMITLAVVLGIGLLVFLFLIGFILYAVNIDKKQNQHSVLRIFPLIGRVRYFAEQISPEIKDYFTEGNDEGKPYSKLDRLSIIKAGKYAKTLISLGSERNFETGGLFIRNAFFAKQISDLQVDNQELISTKTYVIDKETLFARQEHIVDTQLKPWKYTDKDAIVVGEKTCRFPFVMKSPIGMSGMSYGALGNHAIEALSIGLKDAGAFMNTGEGGISPHHLKGGADIIAQIGPAKFGYRNPDGSFSWEELRKKADIPQVRAFEIKLGQGAKIRGGHIEGSKVTPEIAEIRGVEPYKTVDSPNRFEEFDDMPSMMDFVEQIREETGKPVGIKIVIGSEETFDDFVRFMKVSNRYPDFITIDGGEGGTGATYQSMADSVGLPIKPALLIANRVLKRHKVRQHVKIFASGKLFSPDRIAIALAMGADVVLLARGFMIALGCIQAKKCASNDCPVGVATTDPKLQQALVIEEKRYRVTNYITTLRQELFMLSASAGLTSPRQFNEKHVVFVTPQLQVKSLPELMNHEITSKEFTL